MTAQKGESVVLKVGNGATPTEIFIEIGGLRDISLRLNNDAIESNNLTSGKYRRLISQSGISSMAISGKGYFTDSTSEETLRGYAFSGTSNNFEISFGNGDKISGAFVIKNYERSGNWASQEDYSIILQSAGGILFTNGT